MIRLERWTLDPEMLDASRALAARARALAPDATSVAADVAAILADVRARGEEAVLELTRRFDTAGDEPDPLRVDAEEARRGRR